MSLFLHFLLTHFIADYPLQSHDLIHLKQKSYWGVLLHCLVHLAVMLTILSPLLHEPRVWLGVAVIFVTHNLIDQAKVTLDKRHPSWIKILYFTDQAAHIAVVAGVSLYLGKDVFPQSAWAQAVYANRLLLAYLLCLVLSTYFYDVTRYFVRMNLKKKGHFQRDYWTMGRNALLVSIAFGLATLM